MNSSEFVLNAELHLYMVMPPYPPNSNSYLVSITAVLPNRDELKPVYTELQLPTSDYIVVPVVELTRTLISLGKKDKLGV